MLKRFFSVLRTRKIPDWLGKKLSDDFSKYPQDAKIVSDNRVKQNAQEIQQVLERKAEEGCEDSKSLLDGISELRKPTSDALPVTNVPTKDIRVTEYLSRIIASIFNPNLRPAETFFFLRKKSRIPDILPHSDGSTSGNELALTQISAVISDGTISTYIMDINDLRKELSEESQKILREPIFGYTKEPLDGDVNKSLLSLKMPIFYDGRDGALNINLFHGSRHLLQYDENKTSFSEEKIHLAIEQLHSTIDSFLREGKIEKLYLKEGEALYVKNKASLHGVINESGLRNLENKADDTASVTKKTHRGVLLISHTDPTPNPRSPESSHLKNNETVASNQI